MKKSVYMAGKVKDNSRECYGFFDWRNEILEDRDHETSSVPTHKELYFNYSGPYYIRDHGDTVGDIHGTYDNKGDIFFKNIQGIDNCDYVFVYLDTNDSFGTLAEIGYANGIGKQIHVYYTKDVNIDELWFVFGFTHSTTKVKDHIQAWDIFSKKVLNYTDYKEYLQSDYWKELSAECKKEAGNKCKLCNSTKKLNVHHRSYDNLRNREKEKNDLIVLCEECHKIHHKK